MKNNMNYQVFEEKLHAYRLQHPSTADMDHSIFRSYCAGKNAVQIGMEVHCSESTVYRALRRVRRFLDLAEQDSWLDALQRHIAKQNMKSGDRDVMNPLDMLYVAYVDSGKLDDENAIDTLANFFTMLDNLSIRPPDAVYDAACDLCVIHERVGFTEGIKAGIQLGNELNI